jgi:hypothetical protein
MSNIVQPSEKARQTFAQIREELRQKDSKFIRLQPNEKRLLQFNPETIEQIEAEFNGRKT